MRLSWNPATGLTCDLFMQSPQLHGTHVATSDCMDIHAFLDMNLIYSSQIILVIGQYPYMGISDTKLTSYMTGQCVEMAQLVT